MGVDMQQPACQFDMTGLTLSYCVASETAGNYALTPQVQQLSCSSPNYMAPPSNCAPHRQSNKTRDAILC